MKTIVLMASIVFGIVCSANDYRSFYIHQMEVQRQWIMSNQINPQNIGMNMYRPAYPASHHQNNPTNRKNKISKKRGGTKTKKFRLSN